MVLLYGIILVLMISSSEHWYAYLILLACVGALVYLRRMKFWHGWRVPLFWLAALVVAWSALFAGQPSADIQPYLHMELEQPSAPNQLLLKT